MPLFTIPFTKMQALGNDFVIVEKCAIPSSITPSHLAKHMADRRLGVGCDQVLLYEDHHVTFLNQDGSTAEACGNGSRAFALFLATRKKLDHLLFQAGSAQVCASVEILSTLHGIVTLSLEEPSVLFLSKEFIEDIFWLMNENVVGVFHISTGNPHLVVFVKYFDEAQFNMVAPQLASAPDFKSGVNITFAEVKENELFLNVLERGAGRTPACGTAAFATAFAAQHASLLGKESVIKVHQEGGSLTFLKKQSWHMIGPAHISFEGQYFYNP